VLNDTKNPSFRLRVDRLGKGKSTIILVSTHYRPMIASCHYEKWVKKMHAPIETNDALQDSYLIHTEGLSESNMEAFFRKTE